MLLKNNGRLRAASTLGDPSAGASTTHAARRRRALWSNAIEALADNFAPLLGLVALMAAVSTFVVALSFWDGESFWRTCVLAGVAMAGYAWRATSVYASGRPLQRSTRIAFVLAAALEAWVGLAWSLGVLGAPIAASPDTGLRQSDASWLTLFLLLYAALSYGLMRLVCTRADPIVDESDTRFS